MVQILSFTGFLFSVLAQKPANAVDVARTKKSMGPSSNVELLPESCQELVLDLPEENAHSNLLVWIKVSEAAEHFKLPVVDTLVLKDEQKTIYLAAVLLADASIDTIQLSARAMTSKITARHNTCTQLESRSSLTNFGSQCFV
uniref:Uncharacterized protein n=1 Tax=Sphaerodactylus townsendi TaxID=933632 RepID=A0ACB8G5L4_9SAUR